MNLHQPFEERKITTDSYRHMQVRDRIMTNIEFEVILRVLEANEPGLLQRD